ncbi:vacuolar alkaline phosphatase [Coemansia sp. RSA 988]|nr:vacuolar alkaline phosphatase [Coemansia sp. RSA 988]
MARSYMQQSSPDLYWASILDSMLTGSVRTQSSNSLVTDSAAGATAFSCGLKTYNKGIAVDNNGRPCGTILEAAKAKGLYTGLITTARITHATPASFAAHVTDRDMEDLIALQLISRQNTSTSNSLVDLMMGGGLCHFLPQSNKNSCRSDNTDVWQMAQQHGISTIFGRKEFDNLYSDGNSAQLPLLALFSDDHMDYEIDRNTQKQPSLSEMSKTGLNMLDAANNTQGFFLMIEGARIDMAGHDNDPATHLHDIIEYWRAVKVVRNFVDQHPDTLLISTSDHETGGLTLGTQDEYFWLPQVLQSVRRSAESICAEIHHRKKESSNYDSRLHSIVKGDLGISNATSAEMGMIRQVLNSGSSKDCKHAIGHLVSDRAHIGWSTGGHSAADVGLFAYGPDASMFKGSIENSQLGRALADYLDVDTGSITKSLDKFPTRQLAFVQRDSNHDHD